MIHLADYIAKSVLNIHTLDEPESEPVVFPNTYNPPKNGHDNSCLICKTSKKVNDDPPDEPCNKNIPIVSKTGESYAFFWFCPVVVTVMVPISF